MFVHSVPMRLVACAIIAGLAGAARAEPSQIVVAQAEKAAKVSGEAEGVIKGVDAEDHKVRIDHGPITGTLEMMGMTMAFRVAPEIDLAKVKTGDKVKFTVTRDAKGLFLIEKLEPAK